MGTTDQGCCLRVLMLPWLAHGHITPFLELAKKLSQRNCYVYFCSTPVNLSSIKQQLREKDLSIQLLELLLPQLPELPPECQTTKSLPTHLMPTLKQAFDLSQPSFANILSTLKPDVLMYDFIQPWAPATASAMGIPAILFLTTSATSSSFFRHFHGEQCNYEFPSAAIYLEEHEARRISRRFGIQSNGLTDKERFYRCSHGSTGFIAIKTFRELESKYIDYLSDALGKEIVPVGPLVLEHREVDLECKFMSWLGNKERASTVFVSFGTEYFMSEEEIEELALGLELSEVNFIWVVRFPEGARKYLQEALPSGFLERVGTRGLVVEGWAPQGKILSHSSIGGFLTHCGWSSVMEGIWYGVPLIALPMQLDQPLNARLSVELGVGIEIKKEGVGEGQFRREEVSKRIREVMTEKEGEAVRGKVKEMSEKMRMKDYDEIDILVEKLIKLCHKKSMNAKLYVSTS